MSNLVRLDPALIRLFCCFNNIRGKFDSLVGKAVPFTLLTTALLLCNVDTGKLGVMVIGMDILYVIPHVDLV